MFNHKRYRLGDYLFAGLSIAALSLSLIGYLGRLNLYFEFASGYKLQILIMALCSLIYFCLTRRRFWIVVSLTGVIINLAVILPWYFNRPAIAVSNQNKQLKVLSYNVLWKNKRPEHYQKAIALVEQEQTCPYHIYAKKLEIEVYSKLPLLNPEIQVKNFKLGKAMQRVGRVTCGQVLCRLEATALRSDRFGSSTNYCRLANPKRLRINFQFKLFFSRSFEGCDRFPLTFSKLF